MQWTAQTRQLSRHRQEEARRRLEHVDEVRDRINTIQDTLDLLQMRAQQFEEEIRDHLRIYRQDIKQACQKVNTKLGAATDFHTTRYADCFTVSSELWRETCKVHQSLKYYKWSMFAMMVSFVAYMYIQQSH